MLRNRFGKPALGALAGALLLAISACGGGGGGGGDAAKTGASGSGAATSDLKVGLAFDIGGRGDKSFNDSAYAGLTRAKDELAAEVKDLSPVGDGSNRGELLRQLAGAGFNPIIGVGFAYAGDVETVAKEYPDVQFGIVDAPSSGPNVTGLTFAEHEGSYLAGVAAALKSKSGHLGFVGGVESDLIRKFEAGFVKGAKDTKPDIKIDSKYLTPDGDFKGFKAPDKGKTAAEKMFEDGADIVYHAAGDSGLGVFQAAAAAGAGKWAIGVDSDQAQTVKDAALQKIIMTSMIKRVDNGVFEFVKSVQGGAKGGQTISYDLKLDGVGLATTGDHISDVQAKVDEAKQKIISGEIKVPDKP
ncbi:BMP family ABC transporter substrate-binding protein [Spongiactinospora rosea]|uniref:BMP family ABC transporter substrate-binding protein n=1 Tax=Spongiactinospora rosea TaxID=2248750 RepID=A0A366LS54_9ACTN|nr:BMP family ABC transporter substrate-binding protein [Spongiactinospora rosea]RBQ16577.1 BMP family ABC transporter substrate-binding protein [Spongiactinospora rosea]